MGCLGIRADALAGPPHHTASQLGPAVHSLDEVTAAVEDPQTYTHRNTICAHVELHATCIFLRVWASRAE